ncbi:hypothetical protein B0J18DRAFT_441413, partial [Chaetomium sp. MPI-SDFR-AT-0129]
MDLFTDNHACRVCHHLHVPMGRLHVRRWELFLELGNLILIRSIAKSCQLISFVLILFYLPYFFLLIYSSILTLFLFSSFLLPLLSLTFLPQSSVPFSVFFFPT